MKRLLAHLVLFQFVFSFSEATSLIILDRDLPCAQGISTIPPLDLLSLPKDRFPPWVPSGVNVCDISCEGQSVCTYNWADSMAAFPFLLFKCQCHISQCPLEKILFAGYLPIYCKNVTKSKSRCNCPYRTSTYQCSLSIQPVQSQNAYYCTCCSID